ncbi:MFS transporter [Streptomyces sp. NPDC046915]|uniref:MFS transporter n=1 Tax=Streptomyces sp. NPDC046915 TaxID=3155257 RepID=UPI0033EB077D
MDLRASLSVLGNRPFRSLLLARLISASGSAMAPVALAFAVLGFDAEPTALAIVLAGNTLPQLVLLLVGGVVADRVSRRGVIVIGNLVAALSQAGVAVLVATDAATTARVALLAGVTGGANALMSPAMNSLLPQLVPAGELQEANVLLRLPTNFIKILAPAAGGGIVAVAGSQWVLGWDAASFAAAALLCARLAVPRAAGSGPRTSVLHDFRTGWREFAQRPWLWSYTLSGTVVVALWLGGYQLLGPLVLDSHGLNAAAWGTVQGSFSAGLLLGGLIALRWKPDRLMVACVATGLPLALPLFMLAARPGLPALAVSAALAGIGLDLSIVCWTTALQQQLAPEVLGRVTSFSSIGELMAVPLGYLVVGLAATSAGAAPVLLWSGVLVVVSSVVLFVVPDVWAIRRLPAEPVPEPARALG